MDPEGLPMHHEDHIAVDALIQKPGEEQVEGSAEHLSSVSLL